MAKKQRYMNTRDALDFADALDLPDGAYWALAGEMMGGDSMDAMEAAIVREQRKPRRRK